MNNWTWLASLSQRSSLYIPSSIILILVNRFSSSADIRSGWLRWEPSKDGAAERERVQTGRQQFSEIRIPNLIWCKYYTSKLLFVKTVVCQNCKLSKERSPIVQSDAACEILKLITEDPNSGLLDLLEVLCEKWGEPEAADWDRLRPCDLPTWWTWLPWCLLWWLPALGMGGRGNRHNDALGGVGAHNLFGGHLRAPDCSSG